MPWSCEACGSSELFVHEDARFSGRADPEQSQDEDLIVDVDVGYYEVTGGNFWVECDGCGAVGLQDGGLVWVEPRDPKLSMLCIRRRLLGVTEHMTYDEWASDVIQERDVALQVAERLLELPDGEPVLWNEGSPRFYEEFDIFDRVALQNAVDAEKAEAA
jgi:hypothetical protein